ncbi:hypothetical protein B0T18DRAFT_389580 [Schizothecium vesticola]|uniref:Extracellular membrane protein CFEM domain-containing protein n=1 Tax=Schizothecium vesticola TaxID=314040 RepID=A0AA40F2Z7_9PEZI|nr:hypothetical protein B0T18DRAFT_389580 [Schizothecium vesticola]
MVQLLASILCANALAALSLARAVDLETAFVIVTAYQDDSQGDKHPKEPPAPRSPSPTVHRPGEKPFDRVYVTPCIKNAANDWRCLCRSPAEPKWPEEMFTCFRNECRGERDSENAKAVFFAIGGERDKALISEFQVVQNVKFIDMYLRFSQCAMEAVLTFHVKRQTTESYARAHIHWSPMPKN